MFSFTFYNCLTDTQFKRIFFSSMSLSSFSKALNLTFIKRKFISLHIHISLACILCYAYVFIAFQWYQNYNTNTVAINRFGNKHLSPGQHANLTYAVMAAPMESQRSVSQITWRSYLNEDPRQVDLEWVLRFCMSHQLPSDTDAAGPVIPFWVAKLQAIDY